MRERFRGFSNKAADAVGSPWAFAMGVAVVIIWALSGPLFHYSDTWQLVINTGTTIITFLMVFLVQNTQNRDARAMQLKLDEVIRALSHARNQLVDVENSPDEVIDELKKEFGTIREQVQGVQQDVEQIGQHVKEERGES